MKKSTLAYLLGLATYFLILSPFWLPDNVVYVKKSQSIYQPYIETIFTISIIIIFIFAINGFVVFWKRILKVND